jgi:hypothetical protein
MHLWLAVLGKRDDCAGVRHLLWRPGARHGLQRADALAKSLQLLGHGGVVLAVLVILRFEELVMLGLKMRKLGGFFFGQRDVVRLAAVKAAPLVVAELRLHVRPAPSLGADRFRNGGKLVRHQRVEQRCVLGIAAAFLVEQVAADGATLSWWIAAIDAMSG